MTKYVVLNDGSTFSPLKGCRVISVSYDELAKAVLNDSFDELLEDKYKAGKGKDIEKLCKQVNRQRRAERKKK